MAQSCSDSIVICYILLVLWFSYRGTSGQTGMILCGSLYGSAGGQGHWLTQAPVAHWLAGSAGILAGRLGYVGRARCWLSNSCCQGRYCTLCRLRTTVKSVISDFYVVELLRHLQRRWRTSTMWQWGMPQVSLYGLIFLCTNQEIVYEDHLWYDVFCVESDVKLHSVNLPLAVH